MINRTKIDLWPLGLNRIEAAQYIGVSPTLFSRMVRRGDMPSPKRLSEGRIAWDRTALDLAFAALPMCKIVDNPWDKND